LIKSSGFSIKEAQVFRLPVRNVDSLYVDPYKKRPASRPTIRSSEENAPPGRKREAVKLTMVEAIMRRIRSLPEFLRRVVKTLQQAIGIEIEDLAT
jgi:hypothetical protein